MFAVDIHPDMKTVIVAELERLLYRPHIAAKAQSVVRCLSPTHVNSCLLVSVCHSGFFPQGSIILPDEKDATEILTASPIGELEETTRTPSYYVIIIIIIIRYAPSVHSSACCQ